VEKSWIILCISHIANRFFSDHSQFIYPWNSYFQPLWRLGSTRQSNYFHPSSSGVQAPHTYKPVNPIQCVLEGPLSSHTPGGGGWSLDRRRTPSITLAVYRPSGGVYGTRSLRCSSNLCDALGRSWSDVNVPMAMSLQCELEDILVAVNPTLYIPCQFLNTPATYGHIPDSGSPAPFPLAWLSLDDKSLLLLRPNRDLVRAHWNYVSWVYVKVTSYIYPLTHLKMCLVSDRPSDRSCEGAIDSRTSTTDT